jgi:hypothetical protein
MRRLDPTPEATAAAAAEVVRVRAAFAGAQPPAGALLVAWGLVWPHDHDPTDADLVALLAAWATAHEAARRGRRVPPYRHDGRVIPLPVRRFAA